MNLNSITQSSLQKPDFAEMREKMFKQADADGSGGISKDELSTMIANAPKAPEGGKGPSAPDAEELFSQIDTDGSGEISAAENDTFMEAQEAERTANGPGMPPPAQSSFDGSTDLVKDLLAALEKGSEEDAADSGTSTDASEAARQKLMDTLIEQLRERNNQYTAGGSTQGGSGLSLFTVSV